ncbi:MAG: heterodisulfide reductase-related iron-sulfur binding cluster, partial [Geminicoccaceae bacterium]|nr:heterodisulfide reductase-related iron-sulfur binding cluster [Geminicoccaceae bacterium]
LTHHMGKTESSHAFAAANIRAWTREMDGEGLDAVVINTSGCGTTVKDYGFMLREDPRYAEKAAAVSAMTKDVTEVLAGCAQRVLAPEINEATIRLLNRQGIEVVVPKAAGCCGALTHHMGKEEPALAAARQNVAAWCEEIEDSGLDAVIINASGCGTTVKDYGFMLRDDPEWSDRAARIAMMTRDITEYLLEIGLGPAVRDLDLSVTYHSACSMQHGQKLTTEPKALLADAGFTVRDVPEGHLCCGSAGTYNLLQPELAGRLKERKLANIRKTCPDVIASGNIGCITQLADGAPAPVVHTVELLDWATGGPPPRAMADHRV